MKELSIKEKAKAYDEALERAKIWQNNLYDTNDKDYADELNYIFPELKEEPEDERIRKVLINVFATHKDYEIFFGVSVKDILAWLEKQGNANKEYWRGYREGKQEILDKYAELEKQGENNKWKPSKDEMDALYGLAYITNKMDDKKDEAITKLYHDLKRVFFSGVSYENMFPSSPIDAPIKLEKQSEQPRYSIGDVLCDKSCTTLNKDAQHNFKIVDIRDGLYICDKGSIPIEHQDEFELVARKVGQKPIDKDEVLNILNKENQQIQQEDLIMKPSLSTKQEWGEGDEKMIRALLSICDVYCIKTSFYPKENKDIEILKDWLKSLEDRYTWKPSEEQMKALSTINVTGDISYAGQGQELIDLYKNLKKLRGE